MRVVVVTDDHPPALGGVATWTAAMVAGLRRAGHDVTVYARARPELPPDVIGVPGRWFGRFGPVHVGLRVRDVRPGDLVLVTTWPLATWLARRIARVGATLVLSGHGSDLTRGPARAPPSRWVVPSRFLASFVPGATVLPAPVDALGPRRRPPERWAFVGRVTPLKGLDRVLRLAAAARVPLTVVGDGPALPAARALAADLGGDVTFTGALPRSRVDAALADCSHLLLLPRVDADGTGAEGFGLVLVEAAARGLAPIGCATGGVPEAVGPGLVLADPDDVDASVARIRAWDAPNRGEQARAWVAATHGVDRAAAALLG